MREVWPEPELRPVIYKVSDVDTAEPGSKVPTGGSRIRFDLVHIGSGKDPVPGRRWIVTVISAKARNHVISNSYVVEDAGRRHLVPSGGIAGRKIGRIWLGGAS